MMFRYKSIIVTLIVGLLFGVSVMAVGIVNGPATVEAAKEDPEIIAVEFFADQAEMYIDDVVNPHTGEVVADDAFCFDGVFIDIAKDEVIATGSDCLLPEGDDVYPAGLEVLGTTIFDFGDGNTIVSQGMTSVQPTTWGSTDVWGPGEDVTHITGAIPSEGSNQILWGTGDFEGATGTVRLSGAVDMSNAIDFISFKCIFVLSIDDQD